MTDLWLARSVMCTIHVRQCCAFCCLSFCLHVLSLFAAFIDHQKIDVSRVPGVEGILLESVSKGRGGWGGGGGAAVPMGLVCRRLMNLGIEVSSPRPCLRVAVALLHSCMPLTSLQALTLGWLLQGQSSPVTYPQIYHPPLDNPPALSLEAFSSWSPLVSSTPPPSAATIHASQPPSMARPSQHTTPAAKHEQLDQPPGLSSHLEYSGWTPFGGSQTPDQQAATAGPGLSQLVPLQAQLRPSSGSGSISDAQRAGSRDADPGSWSGLQPRADSLQNAARNVSTGGPSGRHQQSLHETAQASGQAMPHWGGLEQPLGSLSHQESLQHAAAGWFPFGPALGSGELDSWQEHQLGPGILNGLLEHSSPDRASSSQPSHPKPATCNAASSQPPFQSNPFQLPSMYNPSGTKPDPHWLVV